MSLTDLRYLRAIALRLNGVLWDKREMVLEIQEKLYRHGLIRFKTEPAKPRGARCVPYPTATAVVQLLERGLV